jgi:hypothetical protein
MHRAPAYSNIIGLRQEVTAETNKGLFGQTNNDIGGYIYMYVIEIFVCDVIGIIDLPILQRRVE